MKRQNYLNLFENIEKYNSGVCFIDENKKEFLYKDVIRNARTHSQDLEPRSLIFVLTNNDVESLTAYIGFFKKQLVQVLLDSKINVNLLRTCIVNII